MESSTKGHTGLRNNLWIPAAIICTMFWGSGAPTIKLGYTYFHLKSDDVFSILLFAGVRFFGAGWITLAISRLLMGKLPRYYMKMIKPTMVMALIQTVLQYFFFYLGLTIVSGAAGVLLSSTGTFFAVIIAVFIGMEAMTGRKFAGIIFGLIGVIVFNLSPDLELTFRWNGELFILLTAICYALHNVLVKHYSKEHEPVALTGFQFILGGVVLCLIGIAGGGSLIWPGFAKSLILLYLMFQVAVAYALWSLLLKRYDTSRVVIFNALTPIFGAVFSWLILGDDIWRWNTLVALLLVVLGISLINWKRKTVAPVVGNPRT
ncbi:MAG TPA: DMT family transporter [Clostridiaceae bacterium]|nr:DMT family transporter [Clostridiaceae bacterium]